MNHITKTPNRLINEKSPYLVQHAYNPVNWYPWTSEAFEKASKEEKPIFLSIGYSTCHWCHVMEKESFKSPAIASILNNQFVSIKVDREERPDIDSIYMSVCQILTGSGGWPLTIFMTPDQKPFFAGTYFPSQNSYGRLGLLELLTKISELWQQDRDTILNSGNDIYDFLKTQENITYKMVYPDRTFMKKAYSAFDNHYDKKYGGFSSVPKFPMPHTLLFLFRYGFLDKNNEAIEMASETLIKMYQGGIYDHIGGGFSRYSTDEKWLIPHFEKMLYDNALLVFAYAEGYALTKNNLFKKAATETISYMLRELKDKNNGFYCGQDADSEGEEGKYYAFTKQEILNVLGKEAGENFCSLYHITSEGNFDGKNIPNRMDQSRYFLGTYKAKDTMHIHETHMENPEIKEFKNKLYEYRKKRTYLHTDDKQLTSWNSMVISAFAKASYVFDHPPYLDIAEDIYDFIERSLVLDGTQLFVRYKDGEAKHNGLLDDYAYYAWALIELYESSLDLSYLEKAAKLTDCMIADFWDDDQNGFYMSSIKSEKLIIRPKETYDGAIPSGNSVAAYVLSRIYQLTSNQKWKTYLDKQLTYLYGTINNHYVSNSFALTAMLTIVYPSIDVICVGNNEKEFRYLIQLIKTVTPYNLNIIIKTKSNEKSLSKIAPFTADYQINHTQNTYYICEDKQCLSPFYSEKEVLDFFTKKTSSLSP